MEKLSVECLRCGTLRTVHLHGSDHVDAGECPRCMYVGWAPSSALNEAVRRRIREHPPERRARLRQV
jgi:Zn ribbon nucleic-acid-binding protein